MAVTKLTAGDIALTKEEEGFVSHVYHDVVGVATIGYGTTLGAGVVNPLPETCTEAQATGWLLAYMNRDVVPAILRLFKPANGNELGGLADLGYNCGSGVFLEEPMLSALQSKDRARIGEAFMAFDHAGGEVLSDLVHRREADRALFVAPVPHVPTYHYDWYPPKWQTSIRRYDVLRKLEHEGKLKRVERVWLAARRHQCSLHAGSVSRKARRLRLKNGKPSWSVEHRGWMFQELDRRGHGKYVLPH